MPSDDDFAAFMDRDSRAVVRRLARGESVRGPVTHIGSDSVFVALGTRADGRIPRLDLVLPDGKLRVRLGQEIEAMVVDPEAEGGPLLAVTLGRDHGVDLESLELALQSGTPVQAKVTRAVNGGLELELGNTRAFCPASQIERSYVADLTGYVGQEMRVAVVEIKDAGRSVVVSRRRVLDQEQLARAAAARERLSVGADVTGTVSSIQKYGVSQDQTLQLNWSPSG
jgi:small subunit ribosomal protein S1